MVIHELLNTQFDACCRDFKCLLPFKEKIKAEVGTVLVVLVIPASKAGITTNDILKSANWSSESVFQKFYHKEVDNAAYGRAVINQNSSK